MRQEPVHVFFSDHGQSEAERVFGPIADQLKDLGAEIEYLACWMWGIELQVGTYYLRTRAALAAFCSGVAGCSIRRAFVLQGFLGSLLIW